MRSGNAQSRGDAGYRRRGIYGYGQLGSSRGRLVSEPAEPGE